MDDALEVLVRICPACNTRTDAERCPNDDRPTVDEAKLRSSRKDPFIGVVVEGRYAVEERLGRGGFGAVYKARHTETGGHVAIKLLHAQMAEDDDAIRRFYIEAQNTHKLQHPNTVRVSDFGRTDEGVLYLVMEYVAGMSLAAVL